MIRGQMPGPAPTPGRRRSTPRFATRSRVFGINLPNGTAELRDEITFLRDETRDLKGFPKRPRMKPGGIAAAAGEADAGKAAKTDGRGRGRK